MERLVENGKTTTGQREPQKRMRGPSTVASAAGFIAVATVLSRVFGYLRDVIIYYQFGQNHVTDAYNAAFSIPDFLYMILVGGALSAAFVPVFSNYLHTGHENEGWKVASIVFNMTAILLTVGVALGIVFSPHIVRNWLVPDFNEDALLLTTALTRIMFAQAVFMSLAGITTGILNSYKRFKAPAMGAAVYNVGVIVGGLLLAGPVERLWPGYGIAGFSVGVVFGALLNLLIQVPSLRRTGIRYSFSLELRHPGVKKLLALIIPIFIGLSVSQINHFVSQNLASGLDAGMVAALRTAQRLMYLPVGIFAVSIAVASFPAMSAQAAKNELQGLKDTLSSSLRNIVYIVFPCAVGMVVLREPVIRFMYEFAGGKFNASNTEATGTALLFYCIGMAGYAAIHILNRAFYSLQETKTPVFTGVAAIIINIIFSLLLIGPMAQGGLALAYSLAGLANTVLLVVLWRKRVGNIGFRKMLNSFERVIAAAAMMGLAVWGVMVLWESLLGVSSKLLQALEVIVCAGVGISVYAAVTMFWHMEEAQQILGILCRRFRKRQANSG